MTPTTTLWDWNVFFQTLVSPSVFDALGATVVAAVLAQLLGAVLGLVVGLGRMNGVRPVRWLSTGYVELFRGTPLLIQILLFYVLSGTLHLGLPVLAVGVIAIATNEAAYMAEIVRTGFLAVDRQQQDAARVLGLGRWMIFRHVSLPQALPVILPPFGTSFNSTIKATSMLSFISFPELLRFTTLTIDTTYRPFEAFAVAAIYYLAITTVWSGVQALLERRFGVKSSRRPRIPVLGRVGELG
jgi:polar amino acid transport system permease protein